MKNFEPNENNNECQSALRKIYDYDKFHFRAKQLDDQGAWIKKRTHNLLGYYISRVGKKQKKEYKALFRVLDKENIGKVFFKEKNYFVFFSQGRSPMIKF
jgi:hypothetical protein